MQFLLSIFSHVLCLKYHLSSPHLNQVASPLDSNPVVLLQKSLVIGLRANCLKNHPLHRAQNRPRSPHWSLQLHPASNHRLSRAIIHQVILQYNLRLSHPSSPQTFHQRVHLAIYPFNPVFSHLVSPHYNHLFGQAYNHQLNREYDFVMLMSTLYMSTPESSLTLYFARPAPYYLRVAQLRIPLANQLSGTSYRCSRTFQCTLGKRVGGIELHFSLILKHSQSFNL